MRTLASKSPELADDQLQGPVRIPPAMLNKYEKLVESMGLAESTMSPVAHHLLVGGLAYLEAAPVSGMSFNEVKALLTKCRSVFKMQARTITKLTEREGDAAKDAGT